MKKFLAGLIAAFMLSAGFVTISGQVANAAPSARACVPSQYVTCPATSTTGKAPKTVKRNKTTKVTVTVKAQGNVKPKGTVVVAVKGPGVNKKITKPYNGKTLSVPTPKLTKKGTYQVTITFTGSNAKSSKSKTLTIRVK
jgi:multidrug efflux pump subunit AcrA (membrane-fusion protein)